MLITPVGDAPNHLLLPLVASKYSATNQLQALVMVVSVLFKKPTYLVEFYSSPYLVFEPVELDESLIR